jgi:uncharacterized protein involved in response to NO
MRFDAPLWSAGFRPFFLFGAFLGPLLMAAAFSAEADAARAWHGHEMVFGFAFGICAGFILTALPSWAGAPAITGERLALLLGAWLLGRLGMAFAGAIPSALAALADLVFVPLFALLVLPGLARLANKVYLLGLSAVLALLFAGNLLFHAGVDRAQADWIARGVEWGLFAKILLFVLVWGYLTPIFTANARSPSGLAGPVAFRRGFEALVFTVSLMAILVSMLGLDARPTSALWLAAGFLHLARFLQWRPWTVAGVGLVSVLHLAYLWLIAVFVLRGLALPGWIPMPSWVHAFTTGALGLMMVGMMTRVVLRHTGRALVPGWPFALAVGVMVLAAPVRLAANFSPDPRSLLVAAAILWSTPFLIYLAAWGRMLVAPSLPYAPVSELS